MATDDREVYDDGDTRVTYEPQRGAWCVTWVDDITYERHRFATRDEARAMLAEMLEAPGYQWVPVPYA